MENLKKEILEDHRSHYLQRLLNRNPLLRFIPNSLRMDVFDFFTDVPRGALALKKSVSAIKTAVSPEHLLECILIGEKAMVPGIDQSIEPKLYKIGIQAKELSRINGQHALFVGYPLLEICQASEKTQAPIYAPLFLIPIKEDGLGAKNQQLFIEPQNSGGARADIRPNLILKQWIASKYDKNVEFNIEEAVKILQQDDDRELHEVLEESLSVCFSNWTDLDNRRLSLDGLGKSRPLKKADDSFIGARLVNSAILGVADFKGQSLVSNIDLTIQQLSDDNAALGILDVFLKPIEEISPQPIVEPNEPLKFLVCSSDPSQENVLWKARTSGLTVIQGPPGTGKSQTIVNMICDALAAKKRIAVFSQKRAALDVIYKRAKRDGFGGLCLMLDDAHKQRKTIIETLRSTTNPLNVDPRIEGKRNAVAADLMQSEYLVDTGMQAYFRQEGASYRHADILARQQALNIKKYNNTPFWRALVDEVASNIQEMNDVKREVTSLSNQLISVGYARSPWRSFRLEPAGRHDREETEQHLLLILKFHDQGVFEPKDVVNRSRWLMTSAYLGRHAQSFGILNVSVSYQGLADSAAFFMRNLEDLTHSFDDIASGQFDVAIYQSLRESIGKSHDVIQLKKLISGNPLYKVLHDGYLDRLSDWGALVELAYLEGSRISLRQQFPNAYDSVADIRVYTEKLRTELDEKLKLDRQWIPSLFNEKEQAVNALKIRDSLRLKGSVKTNKRKTEIRDLFHSPQNFEDVSRIFPVILSNPETACTVFPLTPGLFDLVIIDEASQMFVAEALPLLYRGKQVVIAGDSKQMPPSDFFSSVFDEEEWLDDSVDDEVDEDRIASGFSIPAHGEYCLLDAAELAVCGNDGKRLLEVHYMNHYEVDTQVGEGGFRIDLAVKNPGGMGYICGIECDGASYHSGWKARQNDIWRQGILESKGWSILRIWSTDWFNDKDNVQNEILEKLSAMKNKQSENLLLDI